jgi:hypothetical protein
MMPLSLQPGARETIYHDGKLKVIEAKNSKSKLIS